jgi:hypothetical protein
LATLAVKQLQLAPLGAGDLIDRTVRLYRRHFMALVRASAPPVVFSAAGTVLWSVSIRAMAVTGSGGRLFFYVMLAFLGIALYLLGLLAQLIVMGGASRNLVMHLLWGEPVTARLIYRSVRSRLWALVGASLVVGFWMIISLALALTVMLLAMFLILIVIGVTAAARMTWLTLALGLVLYVAALFLTLLIFFLLAGLAAYVPQALMVEGKGVLESISRSAELARGHVRRLMGMFLFTSFASYAALMLLLIPLGWAGYLNGVNPLELDATRLPAWYVVSRTVVAQFSAILLAPVWMMGLSLLYVDQRVRREGYDIELMAAQKFGDMPELPFGVNAPLAPALAAPRAKPTRADEEKLPGSILGL